ncbi:TIGR03915 family putative DNA repair protein [Flavobacteriaceae bacterium 3-367]|uniref:TIGR03915 family putative DNA repair protein n=1 Tax=Eudoraea algarum TaxID=3417568 RepID=UPI00327BA69F
MKNAKTLIYDGSFNGFLTAIFKAFEEKMIVSDIQKESKGQEGLFSETEVVFTQIDLAKRVWTGIGKKSNLAIKNVYFAFLSESKGIELLLYRYVRKLFAGLNVAEPRHDEDLIFKVGQLAHMVAREKRRTETSLRFQLTQDQVYFAAVDPDFNILPLISKHFRSRYTDKPWIIYDTKRKYGLYYNLDGVELVSLNLHEVYAGRIIKGDRFLQETSSDQEMWDNYFKEVPIISLLNKKLLTTRSTRRNLGYSREKTAV